LPHAGPELQPATGDRGSTKGERKRHGVSWIPQSPSPATKAPARANTRERGGEEQAGFLCHFSPAKWTHPNSKPSLPLLVRESACPGSYS